MTDLPIAQPRTEGNPPVLITVFTKNSCPKCKLTHDRFDDKHVPHRTINVQDDLEPRAEFARADGTPRTPFEYVVEEHGRAMPAIELRLADAGRSVLPAVDEGGQPLEDDPDATVVLHWNDMNPARIGEVVAQYSVPEED